MASYWMKRLSAMILSIWHIVLVLTCMKTCFVLFRWDIKQYISYRSEIQATLLRYAELALSAGKMMSYFFTHMFRYLQMVGPQLCWILFYIMFSSFWVSTCKVHMLNGLYILSLIYQLGPLSTAFCMVITHQTFPTLYDSIIVILTTLSMYSLRFKIEVLVLS